MNISYDLSQYINHPEVVKKVHIVTFFDTYGLTVTKDAFKIGRSTIFLWRRKIKEGKGSLLDLINKSKKPYNTRRMYVNEKIYEFIRNLREEIPRIGKDKIKVLLDEYCRDNNILSVSSSKIGKIIKRNNLYFYLGKREKGKQIRPNKKRVFGYEVNNPGDLFQVDTVVRFEHGIKRYVITAIDITSKFSFAYAYKTHTSKSASDFVSKLIQVTPYSIKAVQTDNGSEFLDKFDDIIAQRGIVHFFTYPKSPKQNAVVERFNRTLQDDCIEKHAVLLEESSTKQFNDRLIDYLLWYNTKRPHNSLDNQTPMKVVVDYLQKSNMCGTDTIS